MTGMRAKLGIFNEETQDETLIDDLFKLMKKYDLDYTNTFRALTLDKPDDAAFYGNSEFTEWQQRWKARIIKAAKI